ncbi:helix-turn-helix domain-containing protein [Streptomyces sp. NBC_00474]|uniref:helix-turn-helix domain-containing protein n=1 Tax=Streptomyces sp. NBC_00474 TaxID=2975754 RepID=UPI00224D0D0C|nr:helix-turn-helix domain-containing protein [Streptomyces sp. NBC_00474]MCX5055050.1 helix-turn-helix domain-containing protein [Streptomyces sp. NBC_00474]
MLSPEQWQEVRRLHAEGMPIKQIARSRHIAPNTVRRLVRSPQPPRYRRPERASVAAPFEPRILRLLESNPALTAADIAWRINWPASASLLRAHVARLRKSLPPPEPAPRLQAQQLSAGLAYADLRPGWAEIGLWRPAQEFDVGHGQVRTCPVLVMVAGDSGRLAARLLPSDAFRNVWTAHYRMLQEWDAVPHTLRWETVAPRSMPSWLYGAQAWDLSWNAYVARAELAQLTIQTGLPTPALDAARRRLRAAFPAGAPAISPRAFAADLKAWVDEVNATATSPARWASEHAAMRTLADASEVLGLRARGRAVPDDDGYLAVAGNHYLVGAWGARRRLTVEITETEVVIRSSGYHAGGFHTLTYTRSWARGVRLTDPQRHTASTSGGSRMVPGP